MKDYLHLVFDTVMSTVLDVMPIVLIIFAFQYLVIRRPMPHLDPAFISGGTSTTPSKLWTDYIWLLLFGASIGCATALAEPALIAVATKANQVSGGAISSWGLRIAVAIGAAMGVTVGVLRIITGIPLQYIVIGAYVVVIIQTFFVPRLIIPLAYDSGGVTTSTVTVPVITALGLGLASTIPGRNPLMDGFGMIATTCLFPIITVMAYAQFSQWWSQRANNASGRTGTSEYPWDLRSSPEFHVWQGVAESVSTDCSAQMATVAAKQK